MTPPASSSGKLDTGVWVLGVVCSGSLLESESGLGCGMSCGLSGRPVGFYPVVNRDT